MKNHVTEIQTRGNKNTSIVTNMSFLPAMLIVFGLILVPSISSAASTLQSKQSESAHRKSTSSISMGRSSLEIFEDGLVYRVTEDVSNQRLRKRIRARFIREIASHLTKYRKVGYDRKAAYLAADALYKASLSQKLIAEGHIQKVADIRGVVATVHVDEEGRIHFGEMIRYEPRQPIYCTKEGRPSVPRNSAIPCLTKKRKGKGKRLGELPQEAQRIVTAWREAQKQQYSSSRRKKSSNSGKYDTTRKHSKLKASNIRRLMNLPDAQLWPALWSQSKKTLLVQFTFKPIFLLPPIDLTKLPIPQEGNSWETPLLVGFTIDENDGWKERWDTTIEVCWGLGLFWCEDYYYYVEPWYNYSYLFGLRIPLSLDTASSQVKKTGSKYTGKLEVDLEPFNGNAADYAAAGLPAELVYNGKEVLASLCHKNCGAGVRGDIPGPDPLPIVVNVGEVNLLKKLPANWPIKTGHLNPPDVGGNEMLGQTKINFDLLFGQATAGIVGAKLYPWLRLDMEGEGKSIELEKQKRNDCSEVNSAHYQKLTYSNPNPKTVNFALTNNNKWVAFERHNYTFDLKLRPGLGPEVWVDLGVWSDDWSYGPWYFPWGPESPNYMLTRHPHTFCAYNFNVTP